MFDYCPKCGEKNSAKQETSKFSCKNCDYVFYFNSKPTASALIVHENRILLGKRGIEPSKGKWDIIGGFLNYGESPENGLRREVREETGLEVEIDTFLGCFMDTYGKEKEATLNIAYTVKAKNSKSRPGDDIAELKWFSVDDLPDDIAFENGKSMIEAWKSQKDKDED